MVRKVSRLWHPRFGRLTEGVLERELGTHQFSAALGAGVECPIPVLGTPFGVYKDRCFPRMGGGAFSSLSDLIAEATGGKAQQLLFNKVGTTGVVGSSNTLWNVGNTPAAGGVAGAAPGGTVNVKSTTGGINFNNPTSGDTTHIVFGSVGATQASNTLLVYDRTWSVTQSLNATNVAQTGVPSRYQSNTGSDDAKGSFISCEVTTVMSATATNFTITYMDQDGNTAEAGSAQAGTVSSAVNRIPLADYRYVLNATDNGVRKVTNVASSGANTGVANFFIGHPLAIWPTGPVANLWQNQDGINSAFNLAQVKDDACISFIELTKPTTTATTYTGQLTLVSG